MNVYDIIGPVMIGPSSSHTAGAVKIGNITRILLGEEPSYAGITLYGSFAKTGMGHGTDKALLAGLCGYAMDDVRIKTVFDICPFKYDFAFSENEDYHPNTAAIELSGEHAAVKVRGASLGAGRIEIQEIDGMAVSFNGDFNTLVIFHNDRKGMIGRITTWLGDKGINIAFMKVFRLKKGERSVMVIETDQQVKEFKSLECFQEGMRVAYYESKDA